MRILVAHNVDRRRAGGMSRIMEFIHDEIAACGHDVDWLTSEDVPRRWGATRVRLGFPWLVYRRALEAKQSGAPYDIVNVHEPHGALVALAQSRVTRHGVVITSHGVEQRAWELALEEARLGRGGPTPRSRIVYPVTSLSQSRIALARARRVLVLSDEDRDYLMNRFGVPLGRIGRMRPGASLDFAAPAASRRYDRADRLVFSGTWRHNKGILELVAAFSALARRHDSITLTVLGAGVPEQEVGAAFPEDVRSRVYTVTASDDRKAIEVLSQSDIFVLPSLFEGTPLTLIEAMMAGLPIVATATCGFKDAIEHGTSGLLVPIRSAVDVEQAVERLRLSADLRASLGRQAHARAAARFTWPLVAREVLESYDAMAGARRTAA